MAVKKGYKQTEVAVIPEDWELKPFGELSQFRNGLNFVKSDMGEVVKVIGVADFQSRFKVAYDHLESVRISGLLGSDDLLRSGDLLFVRSNGNKALIGRCVVIDDLNESVSFSGFTIRGRVSPGMAIPEFIGRFFQSTAAKYQIKEFGEGSHISNLSQQVLARLKIPLPSLREQEAIASALSDADAWIESLEQLIAKKRQIKQGAMQELLTGKRRLPGFSGKWEWKRLGEVATFLSGGTPSRANDHYWKGTIPWISASSLRCFEVCRSDSNVTKEAVAAGSKMAPLGSTLLLVRGSALHNEILCGLVTRLVCFNQDVKALIPAASVVPRFLTTALRAREQDLLGMVTSAGNTAGVLDTKQLKAFEIPVPTSHEQMAITTVLSDMDTEIESLESKLAKAREIKQGMMQELLTGRIRLI
jgi:type I restriction enzyme, S subunit